MAPNQKTNQIDIIKKRKFRHLFDMNCLKPTCSSAGPRCVLYSSVFVVSPGQFSRP